MDAPPFRSTIADQQSDVEDDFTVVPDQKHKSKPSIRHAKSRKSCLSNRYEQLKVEETSDEDSTEETEPVRHQEIPKRKFSKKAKKAVSRPLANALSYCMEKLICGESRESTSQHHCTSYQGSTCPLDQIPLQSFLGNALNLKKDKTSH